MSCSLGIHTCPKNARSPVLFLTDPTPSFPLRNTSLSSLGDGLRVHRGTLRTALGWLKQLIVKKASEMIIAEYKFSSSIGGGGVGAKEMFVKENGASSLQVTLKYYSCCQRVLFVYTYCKYICKKVAQKICQQSIVFNYKYLRKT
jgi:hypothetical protein